MIVDIKDYNLEDLTKLFNLAKSKLITQLKEKIIALEAYEPSDACFLSLRKLAELRSQGKLEWQQIETISSRLAVYKRQAEMMSINEARSLKENELLLESESKGGKDSKGQTQKS